MISLLFALALQEPALPAACQTTFGTVVRSGETFTPSLGEEVVVDVGSPVLVATPYDVRSADSALTNDVTVAGTTSGAPFTLVVPAGTPMSDEGGGYSPRTFHFDGRGPRPTEVHFQMAGSAAPVARLSWGFWKERHQISRGRFELARMECVAAPYRSLTRQLSFVGVSRGVISLEYREFAGDIARPAFTQVATYDLADGQTISFRGARIEVLSADNLGIRYRVLRSFE